MPDIEDEEAPYTTVDYINRRYKANLELTDEQAILLIDEASQKLRDELPAAVARAKESTLERITARMVWEALDHETGVPIGVESTQFGVGPFQESYRYTNPSGRLFITKEDRRALRGGQRAGSIDAVPEDAGEGPIPWAAL